MAVAQGYGKIVTSGSVFAYDVGDTRNSFRGEPAVNLVPNADTMANWGSYSAGNDGTFITEFGTTGYRVRNKNTWNGIARGITLPTPGTYTISAWFRIWGKSSGNNGINVYTSGGGISDTAQGGDDTRIGEWQRISMTRTYTTTSFTFYIISWGGTSGVDWSSWDVTKPQVELKSHVTPFIAGTRSATQGLLDLTGNNTIDLSNVSFDSNAQMTFDGTNDYVSIPQSTGVNITTNTITFGGWCYPTVSNKYQHLVVKNVGEARQYGMWLSVNGTSQIFRNVNGVVTQTNVTISTPWAVNAWNYIMLVYNGSTIKIYLNGSEVWSENASGNIVTTSSNVNIGGEPTQPYFFNGQIAVAQVYNRALTAAEVNQNYRHYKTRFNLS